MGSWQNGSTDCPHCGEDLFDAGIKESLQRDERVNPDMETDDEFTVHVSCGRCDGRIALWGRLEAVMDL